jgi:hypothetical protein
MTAYWLLISNAETHAPENSGEMKTIIYNNERSFRIMVKAIEEDAWNFFKDGTFKK